MKKPLMVVLFCGIVPLAASGAWASCGSPAYIGHAFDSFFNCADTWPVQAFVFEANDPANGNSGTLRVACRGVGDNPAVGVPCVQIGAGFTGDGQVTLETDASLSLWNGCPVIMGAT